MQAWVDLKLVQWAYAHQNSNICDINKEYKCSVVTPRETRYKSTSFDDDQEILMNFDDEKYLTTFILRWS